MFITEYNTPTLTTINQILLQHRSTEPVKNCSVMIVVNGFPILHFILFSGVIKSLLYSAALCGSMLTGISTSRHANR
jgi:hypothetical protein